MALLFFTVLLLSMTNYSSSSYCVCNQGISDTLLQKDIDYACGAGADCSQILQIGSCYQPNTVKSHCDYAVNAYYQKMNQVSGSCNFSGTTTITNTLPSTVMSGCIYPSCPSGVSTSTPPGSTWTPPGSTLTPPGSTWTPPGSTWTPPGSTSSTSPPGSTPGSPGYHMAPAPSGSRECTIHAKSISLALITLFSLGFLNLCA